MREITPFASCLRNRNKKFGISLIGIVLISLQRNILQHVMGHRRSVFMSVCLTNTVITKAINVISDTIICLQSHKLTVCILLIRNRATKIQCNLNRVLIGSSYSKPTSANELRVGTLSSNEQDKSRSADTRFMHVIPSSFCK